MHMLKYPKVIESDIPWRALVVAYLFCVFKIQMTRYNGQWKVEGTVAEISKYMCGLCHGCATQIL